METSYGDSPVLPDGPVNTPKPDAQLRTLTSLLESAVANDGMTASDTLQTVELEDNIHLVQARLGISTALFTALQAKHAATASHSLRVAIGCAAWAEQANISGDERDALEMAALLHDVGKIGVPDRVLIKPQKLEGDEIALMARHRNLGLQVVGSSGAPECVLDVIRCAPTWFGSDGIELSGEALPLGARILSIVDAFDSMTTDHVYRRAMSRERALAELFEYAGEQFDPRLVRQFASFASHDPADWKQSVSKRWLGKLGAAVGNSLWEIPAASSVSQSPLENSAPLETLFLRGMINSMYDGVIFVDGGMRILYWNSGAERLSGYSAISMQDKQWTSSLLMVRTNDGAMITDEHCMIRESIRQGVQSLRRTTIVARNGKRISVDLHAIPVVSSNGTVHGATIVLRDVSSQTSLERTVQILDEKTRLDPLTQLNNRAEFDRGMSSFVETHLRRNAPCCLIMCDIDHFKGINDTFGHQAGDAALISFAALLSRSGRKDDVVARYGGEEFAIICADCDNMSATKRADDIRLQLSQIEHPTLKGKRITASFGVTELQSGDNPETMLRRADRALMNAKENGRNRVEQLGAGLSDIPEKKQRKRAFWNFRQKSSESMLARTLKVNTPLSIAVEKLRGFIADHHANILTLEEQRITLEVQRKPASVNRRDGDRIATFIVDMQIMEMVNDKNDSRESPLHSTLVHVDFRPKNARDRRKGKLTETAEQLLASLRSYLMAYESDDVEWPTNDSNNNSDEETT